MFQLTSASFRKLEIQFIADLLKIRSSDPLSSLLVVIPTGRLRTHLQTQLAATCRGLFNVHFLTFFGLAEQLLADGPAREDRVVGESALYHEVIQRLLEGTAEPVFTLKNDFLGPNTVISRGLPAALANTLKDLRDSGMRVTDAMNAALDGHLGHELESAAPTLELYAHVYSILQKHHLRTPSDLLRRAAEHAPQSSFLRNQQAVFFYGFYDLTGVQLDLALRLSDHPEARAYFPYESGNPAYAYAERLLMDPAFIGKCAMERSGEERTGIKVNDEASHLPIAPFPHLSLTACSGAHDEVWFAAKEILRLLDEGVPAHEIAVIARTLDPYLPALRDVFGSHLIPFSAVKGEPAGTMPRVKALRAQVRQGADDSSGSWTDQADWVRTIVAAEPARTPEEFLLDPLILETLEDLKVLDVLNKPVSRRHFIEVWEEKLDSLERPLHDESSSGVQALEVQQARGLRFKAVFLLGLNEKSFPRLIREDPFLSDAARSALAQALGCRLGRKLDGYPEERLMFELMCQTADTYLYLLWQRSDEEGKALIPSIYVQELMRTQKLKATRLPRALPDKLKGRTPVSLTPKELSYWINRAGATPDPLYTALGWNTEHFNRLLRIHRSTESFRPGILPFDGLLEDTIRLKNALKKGFSPSGLEDMAECPFQYYAGHILRLPVPDDPAPGGQIAPSAMGKLFHRTLELYFTFQDLAKACDLAFGEFTQAYPELYPLIVKSSKVSVMKHLSVFIKSDLEDCKATGYTPTYFEREVEGKIPELGARSFRGRVDRIDMRQEKGEWVARVVDYKSGHAQALSGRLETALIQGKFLQLPVYMELVRMFLKQEKHSTVRIEASTLRWLRLEDQDVAAPSLTEEFWKSPAAKYFIESMKGLSKTADKGHFYIEPSSGEWGHCGRCSFARVCRKEHMPTRTRAENDPVRIANRERLTRTAAKGMP